MQDIQVLKARENLIDHPKEPIQPKRLVPKRPASLSLSLSLSAHVYTLQLEGLEAVS